MKKKAYVTPGMRIVNIEPRVLICASQVDSIASPFNYGGGIGEDIDIR